MNQDTEDKRKGTEILFDHLIRTAIHMTPSPPLRKDIYQGLERVAYSQFDESARIIAENLPPEQFTAYRILERMGLVVLREGLYSVTEKGNKICQSLDREGTFLIEVPEIG